MTSQRTERPSPTATTSSGSGGQGEQPGRHLPGHPQTPAHGVHRRLRSGKSSLVFGTIAAEAQRLINETYTAFVQSFMPSLARPDVDALHNLSAAIVVDQERMGANVRSTVGTATDANTMLRIIFSRLGQPHIGSSNAFSFNIPSVRGSGAITVERGAGKTVRRSYAVTGGMCPRCEGMGSVTDFDLTQLYDDSKSLAEGALTIPGYSVDGWYGRISGSGFLDPDKPIRKYTRPSSMTCSTRSRPRSRSTTST